MNDRKPVQESRKCPTCSRTFLTENTEKQCESCRREGKTLLNE